MTTILVAGAVFLLVGLVGGGLKIRELSVPQISGGARVISFILGVGFCGLYVYQEFNLGAVQGDPPQEETVDSQPEVQVERLAAPVFSEPNCGGAIEWPRTGRLIYRWSVVSGAYSYGIEFDCRNSREDPSEWKGTEETPWKVLPEVARRMMHNPMLNTDVIEEARRAGADTVRARVWAVDADGVIGEKSAWCQIAFFGGRGR